MTTTTTTDFAAPEPIVSVDAARVRFGATEALCEVSFALEPGRILAVVGANGAGKSTLFRAMAGLIPLDAGAITVMGHPSHALPGPVRARLAYVSETHAELGEATVRELAAFRGAMHRGFDHGAFSELIERASIAPRSRFGSLSRGQRALVAVGLALAQQPTLLLLDDPTLGLDPLARRGVVQLVLAASRTQATTVVLATHDVADIERVADDVLFLSRGRVARPLTELERFVSGASSVTVSSRRTSEGELMAVDGVVFVWPRRGAFEAVLSGDEGARARACESIARITGGDEGARAQRGVSLEEATLAWLARDARREVARG